MKTYYPSVFTIGKFSLTANGEKHYCAVPSCKWLKNGRWTQLSRFTRLTNGFKPYTQRDVVKEIKKDLDYAVETLDNTPVHGFRVVYIHHDYSMPKLAYTLIEDPRGFKFQASHRFFEDVLMKWKRGISSDGTLEGKWAYVWADESFLGIWPEEEAKKADLDDSKIEAASSTRKSFTNADLVPGRVYDVISENEDVTSMVRMVFIGLLDNALNLDAVKTFLRRRSMLDDISYHFKYRTECTPSELIGCLDSIEDNTRSMCSWRDAEYIMSAKKALKKRSGVPVFLKLVDRLSGPSSSLLKHWAFYYEDLVGLPSSKTEYSIKLDLAKSSLVYGSKVVKRVARESEDQTLKIIGTVPYTRCWDLSLVKPGDSRYLPPEIRYTSPADYKAMDFRDLVFAVQEFYKRVETSMARRLELAPIKRPADFEAWKCSMATWYINEYLQAGVFHTNDATYLLKYQPDWHD